MKKIFLFAAAALMTACSSSDSLNDSQNTARQNTEPGAVGFEAYTQRATTRAGQADVMTLDKLKAEESLGGGFGVFAYYTNNNEYEQSRLPDFFYNQKVLWDETNTYWYYEPVKYWPNEYGNNANSDDNDKVSYFAYAPYVNVTAASGKVIKNQSSDDQWGITGMSRNSVAGDPLIKYIANFETGKNVDLMWGVCDDPQWAVVQGGTVQQINEGVKGLPWLNVERPRIANTQEALSDNQRLRFTFKHALAQLSVNIDAFVDGYNAANALANGTKIYVRQISFTGFAMKGALNLNNTDPNTALWMDYNGTGEIETGTPVVIYDGRKDGKEGTAGADATNEKQRGLNPNVISNYVEASGDGNTTPGVTNAAQSLFETSSPVMVIPTGEDMEVEIVYDVETADPNLSTNLSDGKTKGSSIENRISKTVSFGANGMQNGKHYTLNLHLGMNSVKFDAAVTDWQEAGDKPEADLPLNMPSFQANTTPVTNDVEVSNQAQPYVFAVYGLTPGEQVTAIVDGGAGPGSVLNGKTINVASVGDMTGATAGSGYANSSGIAYIQIAGGITANPSVLDIAKDGYISVVGAESNKKVQVSFKQFAAPLGLGVSGITTENTLNLTTTATSTTWGSQVSTVTVKKNGLAVTGTFTEATGAGASIGTYVLPANVAIGDVYEITVKAGDAAEETFIAKVGGISFSPANYSVTFGQTGLSHPYQKTGTGTVTAENWTPASGTNASVNATTGVITTSAVGNETITAAPTISDNVTDGWYYTTATSSASYTLTVTKQAATIGIATPTPTPVTSGSVQTVCTQAATLTGSITGTIAASADNGTVAYSVDAANSANFTVDAAGQLQTTASTPAGTYTVTVTATVTDGSNYTYATKTASYTITVTVS